MLFFFLRLTIYLDEGRDAYIVARYEFMNLSLIIPLMCSGPFDIVSHILPLDLLDLNTPPLVSKFVPDRGTASESPREKPLGEILCIITRHRCCLIYMAVSALGQALELALSAQQATQATA